MNDERFPELERDLWPRMQERLARGRRRATWADWALAAAACAWLATFPEVIPGLMMQL